METVAERRIIDGFKYKAYFMSSNPDESGKVELLWWIQTPEGYSVKIYYNRFVVEQYDEYEPLEIVIPLEGNYKNNYALSMDSKAADSAFTAAHGLIQAMRHVSLNVMR